MPYQDKLIGYLRRNTLNNPCFRMNFIPNLITLSVEKSPPLESLRLKVLSPVLPEKEVRIRHRQDWRQDGCGSKAAIYRSQLRHTRNENRSVFAQLD
jgi:hypothetical protein